VPDDLTLAVVAGSSESSQACADDARALLTGLYRRRNVVVVQRSRGGQRISTKLGDNLGQPVVIDFVRTSGARVDCSAVQPAAPRRGIKASAAPPCH
jgi:hypothetical protein